MRGAGVRPMRGAGVRPMRSAGGAAFAVTTPCDLLRRAGPWPVTPRGHAYLLIPSVVQVAAAIIYMPLPS